MVKSPHHLPVRRDRRRVPSPEGNRGPRDRGVRGASHAVRSGGGAPAEGEAGQRGGGSRRRDGPRGDPEGATLAAAYRVRHPPRSKRLRWLWAGEVSQAGTERRGRPEPNRKAPGSTLAVLSARGARRRRRRAVLTKSLRGPRGRAVQGAGPAACSNGGRLAKARRRALAVPPARKKIRCSQANGQAAPAAPSLRGVWQPA